MYNISMIYLGSDHRGFELKQRIYKRLIDQGLKITDLGNDHLDPSDDYVDFADQVAEAVLESPGEYRGILFCGTGVGVDIVANKHDGIRCALVSDVKTVIQSREHEDINVLALPADILDEESSFEVIQAFLDTEFSGQERHIRRLEKIQELEETHG